MIGDKEKDAKLSYDANTDYANEYGDQAVINNMINWLEDKMGGEWIISRMEDVI